MSNPQVIIIGGGLAGLCCARHLNARGISNLVVESSARVGGRAQTDKVDGFLLDRGFQVLSTAYPEAQDVLDYTALRLSRFEPGALIRYRGKFHRFADPWRRPQHLLSTALSPIASLGDKLRIARLKSLVCRATLEEIYERPETTTLSRLKDLGFSEQIIETFFRPFLSGVFLEPNLNTSSRKFEMVFRMFSRGDAALPAGGMGALANQLADALPAGTLRTGARVANVQNNVIQLADGGVLKSSRVVIACDKPAADQLLGEPPVKEQSPHGVTCFYFAAKRPPVAEPILVLNGENTGVINSLCVPSQVAPSYAPSGESLISVSVLGVIEPSQEERTRTAIRQQLQQWYGEQVKSWKHLKTCPIRYALPAQPPPTLSPVKKPIHRNDNLFICGDYLDIASIQGAMVSGRRAGEAVADSL